jgi:pimeloyl-ACP methyl ester carboxylesterase
MPFLPDVLIACGLLLVFPSRAQALPHLHDPPGRLADIGHRRMHLDCQGSGNPTVILEAGGDAYAIDWTLVQPLVAQHTRVCSYDRAGLGWSDVGPADEGLNRRSQIFTRCCDVQINILRMSWWVLLSAVHSFAATSARFRKKLPLLFSQTVLTISAQV